MCTGPEAKVQGEVKLTVERQSVCPIRDVTQPGGESLAVL